jgi:hypothetical protein
VARQAGISAAAAVFRNRRLGPVRLGYEHAWIQEYRHGQSHANAAIVVVAAIAA